MNKTNNKSKKGLWGLSQKISGCPPEVLEEWKHRRFPPLPGGRKRRRLDGTKEQCRLYLSSRRSARAQNKQHTIKARDMPTPTHCKYLGMRLEYFSESGRQPNSASVDRIDNTKGYVKGNIQVISWGANRLKGTLSIEQMVTMARAILAHHGTPEESQRYLPHLL